MGTGEVEAVEDVSLLFVNLKDNLNIYTIVSRWGKTAKILYLSLFVRDSEWSNDILFDNEGRLQTMIGKNCAVPLHSSWAEVNTRSSWRHCA